MGPLGADKQGENLSVLLAWFGRFAVGTARSAVRTLRGGYGIGSKIIAIIALVFLAAMLVSLANNLGIIARWVRGLVV